MAARRRATGKGLQKSTAELRKELAERRAQQPSVVGAGSGNFISTKGMRLTYRGSALDTPLATILLAWAQDFAYFDSPYREDEIRPPSCAALAVEPLSNLQPLEDVPDPQSDFCAGCPQNEFGSDPLGGRGKACANRYRVAILPANDPNHDLALIRVSPSGYGGFEQFITRVESKTDNPVQAWICAVDFKPGTDYPVIEFKELELIEDEELLGVVLQRISEAETLVAQSTYDFTQYEPPKPKRAAPKKKRAARR